MLGLSADQLVAVSWQSVSGGVDRLMSQDDLTKMLIPDADAYCGELIADLQDDGGLLDAAGGNMIGGLFGDRFSQMASPGTGLCSRDLCLWRNPKCLLDVSVYTGGRHCLRVLPLPHH